ncbi:MAG: PDZ domain-containing protein [Planctomycetes bacterium]|nr:PDZ domain-containing protein [Planctomycetota bacterium]
MKEDREVRSAGPSRRASVAEDRSGHRFFSPVKHPIMRAPTGSPVPPPPADHQAAVPVPIDGPLDTDRVAATRVGAPAATHIGPARAQSSEPLPRFLWMAAVVLLMVGVRYFVPWFAEEIQYAITRGRERAEYEAAGAALVSDPTAEISNAGQRVSKRIGPSVVHINVETATAEVATEPSVFFGHPEHDRSGQGSGVIVDASGFILTNYHVVRGASEIRVGLSDGRRVGAQLVGYDGPSDLAVLKVDADRLTAASWGDSHRIDVGSLVWAAGSPFGLQRTVTLGILSAKHRGGIAGTPYQDFLQTDAAVNPGNSGGPLVDEQGRVIGINTAIVGEAYQGVSFAVPSHVARDVFERLVRDGRVARGWLGVQMDDVSDALADRLRMAHPHGVLVTHVVEIDGNSPARDAGVRAGDVIVGWNGEEITNPSTLSRLVAGTQIGTGATLRLLRDGDEIELAIVVGDRPSIE